MLHHAVVFWLYLNSIRILSGTGKHRSAVVRKNPIGVWCIVVMLMILFVRWNVICEAGNLLLSAIAKVRYCVLADERCFASPFVDSAEIATQSGGGGGGSVPAFAPAAKSGPAHAAPSVRDRTDEVPPALLSRLARVVAVPAVTDPVVVVATPDEEGRGGLRIISRPRFRSDHRWRPCRGWCRPRRVVVLVLVVRVGGDRSDRPTVPKSQSQNYCCCCCCVAVVASPGRATGRATATV